MRKNTARLVGWVLQQALPARGRHRADEIQPGVRCADTPTVRMARVPLAHSWMPHGRDVPGTGLVRLYVVAHEQQSRRGVVGSSARAVAR